jgi:Flp pilus assembly protein TadB
MNAESTARSRAEAADEIWKWTVGLGILAVALFPLAIPIVVLTAVAILPLLVPLIAIGLVAGVIAAPVMVVRRLRGRRSASPDRLAPQAAPAEQLHHTARLGVRPG